MVALFSVALLMVALFPVALVAGCFFLRRRWLKANLIHNIPGTYYPYRMVDSAPQPILGMELEPGDACRVTVRPRLDRDMIGFRTEYKKPCREVVDWHGADIRLLPHVKQQKVTGEGSMPPGSTKEGIPLPAKHTWLVQPDGTVLWTAQSEDSGDVFYWVKDTKTGGPSRPSPRSKCGETM